MATLEELKGLTYTASGSLADDATETGSWEGGEEITAAKLNHIDKGITTNVEGIKTLATEVSTLKTNTSALDTVVNDTNNGLVKKLDNLTEVINGTGDTSVSSRLDSLERTMGTTSLGVNNTVTGLLNELQVPEDLSERLTNAEGAITAHATSIAHYNIVENEILAAHRYDEEHPSESGLTTDSLNNRFNDIETRLSDIDGGAIEGNESLAAIVSIIKTELEDARKQIYEVQGGQPQIITYNSLAAHLNRINELLGRPPEEDGQGGRTQNPTGLFQQIDIFATRVGHASMDDEDGENKSLYDKFYELRATVAELLATISHAIGKSGNDDKGGLTERITTLEGSIGTNTGNPLSGRVSALETSLGHASNSTGEQPVVATGLYANVEALSDTVNGKQNKITANGILKRNSNGDIVAAEEGVDYLVNHQDISGKADVKTVSDLTELVNDLANNPTSLTVVIDFDSITYNNEGVPTNIGEDPSVDKDYLLQGADDKYYYWKYIQTGSNPDTFSWEMISGGGEDNTNNTTGIDLTRSAYNQLTSTDKQENTDYYVRETNGLIRHYRYITINNTLTEIEIGPIVSNIKKYNLSIGEQTQMVNEVETKVNYLYLHEFNYGEASDEPTSDTIITSIPLPSGGGSSPIISAQKITRITPRAIIQPLGAETSIICRFFYTSGIAGDSAIGRMYLGDTLIIDNISIISGDPADASSSWPNENVPNGFYGIDISNYCKTLGMKNFRLVITDADDDQLWKDMKWDVNVMNLTLTSDFTEYSINTLGSTVRFTYTANGVIDKVVHFKLNNEELPTVNLSSDTDGVEQSYTIPAQTQAGAYKLTVWLTATAAGRDLPPSKTISRDIIWKDSTSNDIIIASKYRDSVNEPLTQYDVLEIPYTIVGGTAPYSVNYYVDNALVGEVSITGNGLWKYRAETTGIHALKITYGNDNVNFTINVAELQKDIAPVSGDNLALDFNPQGRINPSSNIFWTNGNYSLTVSENFDRYNGGYGSDESGDYFLIKAGSRAVFNYKMFTRDEVDNNFVNTVFETGQELKIIFKTTAVRRADAVWFTNMGPSSTTENAKQVGIQLNVHDGFLKTDAASNTAVNGVEATNTYLYFPYSEEDKIELDININKNSENNNFIMSYEDGCPSKAYPYSIAEMLSHVEGQEANITIGSDDCDVYIYRMRIYNASLTTEQVLRNFIADGKDSTESIERYDRNSIYYDTKKQEFVPYTGVNTVLDPERLAAKIPDVKVLMLETPQLTKNKKDFVPYSSLRCIHAPGGKYFTSRGKEDNWLFQNGYHAGQGTTSDKYGNAARNLDFLFMCDGIHNPSDKVSPKNENFLPGYQSSLILGYGTDEQQEPMYCLDWKDEDTWKPNTEYELDNLVRYNHEVYKCINAHTSDSIFDVSNWELQEGYTSKITLTSNSIPNNFFNLKVNIASSENANNALLQKRYNDFLPYVSPAKLRDARIKNDMEFVPAIIFVKETGQAIVNNEVVSYTRQAFNDDQWHFYALGNIGDSKKTDYTRAYDPEDMNEFTLEISDNNTNNSQFQSGVYMASFYRQINSPIIDNINEYYELSNGGKFGTIQYNNETQYYGNFIKTTDTELNSDKTYYEFIEKRRFIEPYTIEQDKDDNGKLKDTFSAKSAAGEAIQPMSYLFPITLEEWTAQGQNGQPQNMRYWSLFNEKFDGGHTFEMRYACQGNYRDGKLVNDTHGKITVNGESVSKDKYQVDTINTNVWRAFYTWLITSNHEQFVNELEEWCVKSSVVFFYAFTHYYTMMDNRAKNTFWHFAKTGKYRRVSHPFPELLHVYEESTNAVLNNDGTYTGTFVPTSDTNVVPRYFIDQYVITTDTMFQDGKTYYTKDGDVYSIAEVELGAEIGENVYYTHQYALTSESTFRANVTYYTYTNNEYIPAVVTVGAPIKYYYTQYAFDMWVYDCDTALGIDNNGELVFSYGKEDKDYRVENDESSSYVFNGAGSVFWRRLRDECTDDIRAIFTGNRMSECFNADNLIQEFDQYQECYPEAIWRLDVERKYIRSFTGSTENGTAITTRETRFLRDMMQGRKKYQRRQWTKDQDIYFGSKYMLPSVSGDFFEFSCYHPGGQAVTPNWDLTITPYQDMYINISYAETFASPQRVKAGKAYEFKSSLNDMHDSRIRIFGANHIQALAGKAKHDDPNDPEKITGADGLASFYIKANNFEHGKKLRELILGSDNVNYTNGNFTTFNHANDYPILEVLNIKNCGNLGGILDFSKSTALKVIEAQGTQISQVLLPASTGITTLHLPETITKLELKSARYLSDLTINNRNGEQNLSYLNQLNIDDSDYNNTVNWLTLASTAISSLDLISLLNLKSSNINNISELEVFKTKKEQIKKVYLSGTIDVLGSWSTVEKTTYESLWYPGLTLNTLGNEEIKCKVTYYESGYQSDTGWVDEEEITSLYVTANQDAIPDIYANTSVNSLPTREPTIANVYQFGAIDQTKYTVYSGWTLNENGLGPTLADQGYDINHPYQADAADKNIKLYTYYTASPHKYTVEWRLGDDEHTLVKSASNQDYGGGYDLIAPTVSEVRKVGKAITVEFNADSTVTYSIFKGWNKLPTNIMPSIEEAKTGIYTITAQYDEQTKSLLDDDVNSLFYDTSSVSLGQLLVLSRMNPTQRNRYSKSKNIVANLKYNYQMGYEGQKEGLVLVNNSNIKLFNNTTLASGELATYNGEYITPFSTTDGFTIAIDYQFDDTQSTSADAAVLIGCYGKDTTGTNTTGFAIYNNFNINYGELGITARVGEMFNNTNNKRALIGNRARRNMIVIRHPKNSTQLIIYSGQNDRDPMVNTNSSTLNTTISAHTLNMNASVITSDAKLCWGNLRNDISGNIYNQNFEDEHNNITGAYGTIYWAKYWNEDLGAGECRQLAAWPHEFMTAILASVDGSNTNGDLTRPSIYLTTLNNTDYCAMASAKFSAGTQSQASIQGWSNSFVKDLCDQRVFNGLPIKLQAVLSTPRIGSRNYTNSWVYDMELDSYASQTQLSSIVTTSSYIYLPSISSLTSTSNYNNYKPESILERTGNAQNTASDITPYPWFGDGGSMQVYSYNINEETHWSLEAANNNYYNLRFPGKAITWSTSTPLRIFKITPANVTTGGSFKTLIGDLLQPHDIVIYPEGAFMYVTGAEIQQYGYRVQPQGSINSAYNTNNQGGWLASLPYATRSVSAEDQNQSNIIFINNYGTPVTPNSSSTQPPNTLGMNYSFAI